MNTREKHPRSRPRGKSKGTGRNVSHRQSKGKDSRRLPPATVPISPYSVGSDRESSFILLGHSIVEIMSIDISNLSIILSFRLKKITDDQVVFFC